MSKDIFQETVLESDTRINQDICTYVCALKLTDGWSLRYIYCLTWPSISLQNHRDAPHVHQLTCRFPWSMQCWYVSVFCPALTRLTLTWPVNTSGVPRLSKFYTPLHQSSQSVINKIFTLVCSRPATLCNFLDAPELEAFLGFANNGSERWQVVYRCYATLYFVFVVDGAESELGILDLIQVFVEALDRSFENVCELDLVFHFDEVRCCLLSPRYITYYPKGTSYPRGNHSRRLSAGDKCWWDRCSWYV